MQPPRSERSERTPAGSLNSKGGPHAGIAMFRSRSDIKRVRLAQILELIVEDSQLINVYAGELEVRPPGAPTTRPDGRRVDSCKPGATADRAIEFVSGICSVTRGATRSSCARETELEQRRHPIVETDLLCDLAIFYTKYGRS
jgi:hypothetical protein